MVSPFYLDEFKRQASFFLKEKIKTARLALTDVTPAQLLTEEATDGDVWPPDTRVMGVISRAAFEVDDYWRIVDILHKRLMKFERKNWRVSYKAMLLLEHLLTHGPLSIADEFHSAEDAIKEMGDFQFVDEKGVNWGLSVRNLSGRILNLLENKLALKEARGSARKLTREIQGFGSFSHRSSSFDEGFEGVSYSKCGRSNSNCNNHNQGNQENKFIHVGHMLKNPAEMCQEKDCREDHPFFYDDQHQTTASLLSSS